MTDPQQGGEEAKALAVFVEPIPQAGPLADERFVGHFHDFPPLLAVAGVAQVADQQSSLRQALEHRPRLGG